MAPPFRKAEFDIVFGGGISRVGEIIDLGLSRISLRKAVRGCYRRNEAGRGRGRATLLWITPNLAMNYRPK